MKYTAHKFIDVESRELDPKTIKFIEKVEPTYRDLALKEDMYNMEDVELARESRSAIVKKQIAELVKIQRKEQAAYLRIIYW